MNGIEKIKQRIDEDAKVEIDRVLSEAKAEAERISDQYKAQADLETADLNAKAEATAAQREERLVGAAQMDARKTALAAKQELVDKAYALALEKLCKMPDAAYTDTLAALLVQAAPSGKGTVVLAPEDRERVGAAAVAKANELLKGGKLVLAEETRPIKGGFILRDGKIEVNGTFETLVRLQKAETAGAVAKMLFPEE